MNNFIKVVLFTAKKTGERTKDIEIGIKADPMFTPFMEVFPENFHKKYEETIHPTLDDVYFVKHGMKSVAQSRMVF